MAYFVIGTAGHIDHGKTSLVKALTGVDTDFYKEEKERGISIDLGFAPLVLPGNRRVGIVDVPGHERFIKNMVAGASGIDLILLVIDSNEGIMPQTLEHLRILELLNISQGIVVLTKADTVDEEWSLLVEEEVRQGLTGTFLERAPLFHVSAVTGQGIDSLLGCLSEQAEQVQPRDLNAPFRLPVDRVFSVPGFGTIVTGTVRQGRVQIGDHLEILPAKQSVRVRSLQVHGETVSQAVAGQRAAINLTGMDRSDASRGFVLAASDLYQSTQLIDAKIQVLPEAGRTLRNRMRVRFYTGTAEIMGRLMLLDRLEMNPGEEGYAQLELESPVVCDRNDRFIIRLYSPMITLGGGVVIDPHPSRQHRRNQEAIILQMAEREKGSPADRVFHLADERVGISAAEMATELKMTEEEVERQLQELVKEGKVEYLSPALGYLSPERVENLLAEIEETLLAGYSKSRFSLYLPKAQLQTQLQSSVRQKAFADLLQIGCQRGMFDLQQDRVRLISYEVTLPLKQKQALETILTAIRQGQLQPPAYADLLKLAPGLDRVVPGLLQYAEDSGWIVRVAEGIYFHSESIEQALQTARQLGSQPEGFSAAEFRDQAGTSRKYAIALLEYFDEQKYTKRNGDRRIWAA